MRAVPDPGPLLSEHRRRAAAHPPCSEIFDNGIGEPAKVERAGAGGGRHVTTVAEAYMLFVKGVEPMTEYEVAPGVRATKSRRRAELAVRPQEFESWQRAWEITVRRGGEGERATQGEGCALLLQRARRADRPLPAPRLLLRRRAGALVHL